MLVLKGQIGVFIACEPCLQFLMKGFYLLNRIIFVLKMYLKLFFIVHILFFMHRAGGVLTIKLSGHPVIGLGKQSESPK